MGRHRLMTGFHRMPHVRVLGVDGDLFQVKNPTVTITTVDRELELGEIWKYGDE